MTRRGVLMMDGAWMWGPGWGWGGWLVMCVAMVLFWAGLIAATVAGIRYLGTNNAPNPRRRSSAGAEEVLAQRYARGEIDDDEYRRRLTTLREQPIAS